MGTVQQCKCRCNDKRMEEEMNLPINSNIQKKECLFDDNNNNNDIVHPDVDLPILFSNKINISLDENEKVNENENEKEKDLNIIKEENESDLINEISIKNESSFFSDKQNKSRNINNNDDDINKIEDLTTQTQKMTFTKIESKDFLRKNFNNNFKINNINKIRKSIDNIYHGKNLLKDNNSINDQSMSSKRTYNLTKNSLKNSLIQLQSSKKLNIVPKEYVSIKLSPRRKRMSFHYNLKELENNNILNEEHCFNNIICKQFFEKYHLIFVNPIFKYDINKLFDSVKLVNNFMDDAFFYSDLMKIHFSDCINKQCLNRFCSTTKSEFRIYNSKEKYITLQNPMEIIKYEDMKKACYIDFDNKNKIEKKKNKKNKKYFLIYLKEEKFEIFASEKEEIIIKWVSIINYFIPNDN